ncbi:acetyl-CoA synthetase-like protein [Auriscalpium vulgare]|uniref:Acetyl-CoA synthetase-like protein n=1 Tax=Auriscalpium vulgare TaxID=40419 RepID=A0ACB8S723_9AGAM|nr:acetyl-CoA synthetase-like protein [Auriscalpium vulgare]
MASSLQSHLTVLEASAALYASSPAFQLPRCDLQSGDVEDWSPVTYSQFQRDVEVFARHWARVLRTDGIPQRSVIGVWVGGLTYTDVLHIYGLSRAGYIPQLFSVRLPNPVVVFELLVRAKARALLYDAGFASILADSPVPTHCAVEFHEIDPRDEPLPVLPPVLSKEDTLFVFHTSGSTSGSPKLVPCSYRWFDAAIMKSHQIGAPKHDGRRDVTVWMGSMCHIGQTFMLVGSLQHGACTIQPSKIAFSATEMSEMVQKCGLNRLNQFATFLGGHLKNSRQNPKLLALLQSLDEVLYSGLPLAREEETWAYQNGIKLINLFGSTECGAMLLSVGGSDENAPLLRALRGTSYEFIPIASARAATQSESGEHTSTSQLRELVILADSGDCPDSSLRAADGHFHTGDLFLEVESGLYSFRGRDDDWIKSENSLRCDTKAIEDNVLATCADLVSQCIVVGNGRPSPVLFIEQATDAAHSKLKREILRRTRQFHSRRYLHERITSADMIVIVDKGALPRTATKGNIRRKATEELYQPLLDKIFGI